jgi:hypothetical protein
MEAAVALHTLHLSAYRTGLVVLALRDAADEYRRHRRRLRPGSADALQAARYEREYREILEALPRVPLEG